jgi:hypothetical protein
LRRYRARSEPNMFIALDRIYEPSAIQQLPDGRFLIAEDEHSAAFSLLTIRADGTTVTEALAQGPEDSGLGKLGDLEGLATDADGFVYAITSHSRNGKGEEKMAREKLVRFRVDGNRITSPLVINDLKSALTARHPVLARAAAISDVKGDGGLNIEALEFTPDQQQLLVGFRSPLDQGHALIATITNPHGLFESGQRPAVAPELIRLDLDEHGLRGMSWIPALQAYLLISGPVAKEQVQFRLWHWDGLADSKPRRVEGDGLPGLEHAEGITPATIDGAPMIVIVSDDGNREAGRAARFLLLPAAQIRSLV